MHLKIPLVYFISLILLVSCTSNATTPVLEISPTTESNTNTSLKAPAVNEPVSDKPAVDLHATRMIDSGLEFEVCYTTSDDAEWRPMPGHLFYGAYEVYPDEFEILPNETIADKSSMGSRCALIRYRIENADSVTPPVTFSILKLYAAGREMYTPCEEFQQRLSTHSKAYASGLQATCAEASDGRIQTTLSGHDPSVTAEQAQNLLDEIANGEIVGPWEFTITEIER